VPGRPSGPGAGTNQDAIRRHNLGTVLRHLHRDGPLSRAELTTRMQLNRSTIAGLVGELEALGAVRQAEPTGVRAGAGRPSLLVHPCTERFVALATQLRVDDVTVVRVGLGGVVLDRRSAALPPTRRPDRVARTVARVLADTVEAAGPDVVLVGLGISVPGTVGRQDGMVRSAPNLGWTDIPFADILGARLAEGIPRCPAPLLGNDADLGAQAEHSRGASAGIDDLVYLSGDVGVGGGLVAGGAPLTGAAGFAGEIGHLRLGPGGRLCRCGGRGCWETEIGASAVAEAIGCAAGASDALPEVLSALSSPPPALVGIGHRLGEGLGAVVTMLNPRRIILGGLLADVYPVVREACDESMRASSLLAARDHVELALPALGRDSVLLGAAERAFEAMFADPVGVVDEDERRAGRGAGSTRRAVSRTG
jgi:predicted NBD/HSP70 family sugar kinase